MKRFWVSLALTILGLVLAGAILSGTSTAAPTDLTAVARQFRRHPRPTMLWLNFDGWRNPLGVKSTIQPFQMTAGKRDRDIQVVLFRTQEAFAPFDVQVVRAFGSGRYDGRRLGNTTVFVGANTANVRKGKKFLRAHTPVRNTDMPGLTLGDTHRPNSNPYDLAFVDPVRQVGDRWETIKSHRAIAGSIAHEAGHTFGLTHTLSKPIPEMMSYDAPNRFFSNRTLQITDLNQTPTGLVTAPVVRPRWRGTPLRTQNSFTYLRAVLGPRPADDFANVADTTAVDPAYRDGRLIDLPAGHAITGSIERRGDYDVFRVRKADQQGLNVWVRPRPGQRLAPVLMVFDATGRQVVAFDNGRNRANRVAQVVLPAGAAQSYKVVVGAADGSTVGTYDLSVAVRK